MSEGFYDDFLDVSNVQLASSGDRLPDGQYVVSIRECKQHRSQAAGVVWCIIEFSLEAIEAGGEAMAAQGVNGQPRPAAKVGHVYSQSAKKDAETGRKDLKGFLYAGAQCQLGPCSAESIPDTTWKAMGKVFGLDNPWRGLRMKLSVHTKPQFRDPSKSFTHLRWAPVEGQQSLQLVGVGAPAAAPPPRGAPARKASAAQATEPANLQTVVNTCAEWAKDGAPQSETTDGLRDWAAGLGVTGEWLAEAVKRAYTPPPF